MNLGQAIRRTTDCQGAVLCSSVDSQYDVPSPWKSGGHTVLAAQSLGSESHIMEAKAQGEFRQLLVGIGEEIPKEKVSDLRLLLGIPGGTSLNSPVDVFLWMVKEGRLDSDNTKDLKERLVDIRYNAQAKKVEAYERAWGKKVEDAGLEKVQIVERGYLTFSDLEVIGNQCSALVGICNLPGNVVGSGFFAEHDGKHYLVSNRHVLQSQEVTDAAQIKLWFNSRIQGEQLPLKTLVTGKAMFGEGDLDVAIVPVSLPDKVLHPFKLSKVSGIVQGVSVHTIQHPMDQPTKIDGAAKTSSRSGVRQYVTSNTEGGSSGSPIFTNRKTKAVLVAVHAGYDEVQAANYGIFVNDVVDWFKKVWPLSVHSLFHLLTV